MKEKKRPSAYNQQVAVVTRPALPADKTSGGVNRHPNGKLQPGGFTAVWNFDGNKNTKDSSTTKPEKNRIC